MLESTPTCETLLRTAGKNYQLWKALLLMAGHFGSTRKPCRTPQQGFAERGKLVAKGSTLFYNQLLVLGFFGLLFFTLYVQPNFTLHCLSHYAFYLQCIYTSH
jgi:hypothetical protein